MFTWLCENPTTARNNISWSDRMGIYTNIFVIKKYIHNYVYGQNNLVLLLGSNCCNTYNISLHLKIYHTIKLVRYTVLAFITKPNDLEKSSITNQYYYNILIQE